MTAPALILIGEADDWTPADRCRLIVAHARPDGAPITLTVYPGAHHGSTLQCCSPAEDPSAIGSNTTSRRRAMRKQRCERFSQRICGEPDASSVGGLMRSPARRCGTRGRAPLWLKPA
jgi:dienelactone hydrolase